MSTGSASSVPKTHLMHNQFDPQTLLQRLHSEPFTRHTASFYRYTHIEDPQAFRDQLFLDWEALGVLGRVYVAREGINAQISIPQPNYDRFVELLAATFPGTPVKLAVEEAESFLKLIIKVKEKIVADGLDDSSFDVTNVGRHLSAAEFNAALSDPDAICIDVRNAYESEIGHFEGAVLPPADTFRDELPLIRDMLVGQEERKILLYCTGGIRCEKASAWLKHQGFKDVNQLDGGIINYAKQVRELNLPSKFIGKNFVFDARMGERITDHVIAKCHQCGEPADTHTNCRWDGCHLLFIQCATCAEKLNGCCDADCQAKTLLPADEQTALRKIEAAKHAGQFRTRRRLQH